MATNRRQIPRSIDGLGRSGRTDTLRVGAQKALGNMISEYGEEKAVQVFLDKAKEQGEGDTVREKVNNTYKRGARLK